MSSEEPDAAVGEGGAGPEAQRSLTDPKAMRAIAHPVRIALLELLEVMPTLTATQASEALGESPANCAFHLRTLAKYGFIREAGGGKGRERPWTAAQRSINISTTGQADRQAKKAAVALSDAWMERSMQRIRRAFAADNWPDGWESVALARNSVRFMTPEETAQASAEIGEILDRYANRLHHPESRPAGALPVQVTYVAYPDALPPGLPAGDATAIDDLDGLDHLQEE
jgi:predicted transcriptional regulator